MFSFPGSLGLEGYVQVNADDIDNNISLFETDGEGVGAAFEMLCNSLLAGNILFKTKNGSDNSSRFDTDNAANDWRAKVFRDATRRVFLFLKAVKFVAYDAIDDEENQNKYGRKPVILDPRDLSIFVKRDVYGRINTRVFERMRGTGNMWFSWLGGHGQEPMKELKTVVVFWEMPPLPDGRLSNNMKQIWIDMAFEWYLWRSTIIATDQRSNPLVISEQIEQKVDDNKLFLGNPADNSGAAMSLHLGDGTKPGPITGGQMQSLLQAAQKVGGPGAVGAGGGSQSSSSSSSSSSSRAGMSTENMGGYQLRHFKLPPQRQYVKNTLPESPIDSYFAFRTARREAIFQSFGIPYAMVSQQSSLGTKTSMNENAQMSYMDTQKSIKQQLIPLIKDIYRHTLADAHAVDHLRKWVDEGDPEKRGEKAIMRHLETKTFKDSIDVDVAFPGLPPAEVVEKLFLMKAIKWEAYKSFMHSMYGISYEDFAEGEPPNEIMEEIKKKEQGKSKTK